MLTRFNGSLLPSSSKKRPDAVGCTINQSQWGPYKLFGEVKCKLQQDNKYFLALDLVKLGLFSKKAIDDCDMNGVLSFQAIGKIKMKIK